LLVSDVIGGDRTGPDLPLRSFGSLRHRVLDFETVAALRLTQPAGEHSAPGTFEANGGEIAALQGQKPAHAKIGDVA
jgi:hypothetical protein